MGDVVITPGEFDAVIFDLDGVITKTAAVHEKAWAAMFDGYLRDRAQRTGEPFRPFTTEDYGHYVDGKPRYDGVQSFLESRGIEIPYGDPSDPADVETVCGLGNRKNAAFQQLVERDGVEPYESSVRFVRSLQAAGLGTALFSSSRNAGDVLASAGLADLFAVRVDGRVAGDLGLAGKPDPAFLLEATRRLGATPERTAVVEDALSGVEAGRRGGFALVIGVDRIDQADSLRSHGADVVVDDLAAVRVAGGVTSLRQLPTALGSGVWDRFAAARPAVFLDYDGTLTPIVEHPDLAMLSSSMRKALEDLAAVTTVAIVSGRDADDVIGKVGVRGLYYAGSHGFDIRTPSGEAAGSDDMAQFAAYLPALDDVEEELEAALEDVPGANVERKRFAVAVHYRQVAESHHATVAAVVDEIAPEYQTLRVTGGKMIFEFRPNFDWDKGRALAWLLEEMGLDHEGVVPVYIGDDETDEDAFRVLQGRGVGIVVGDEDRPSLASYVLNDTEAVRRFLTELHGRIAGDAA